MKTHDLKARLRLASERQVIMLIVAQWYSIGVCDLLQMDRTKGAREPRRAVPRAIAMCMCAEETESLQKEIGAAFNRCHSMVCHAVQSVHDMCDVYADARTEVFQIRCRVQTELALLRKEKA